MTTNPAFAFVLGTGRCGSTLVHELLARHPDVGFFSNANDLLARTPAAVVTRRNGALYRRLPPGATTKGRARFAPTEGWRLLDRRASPILVDPNRDLVADDAMPWIRDLVINLFHAGAGDAPEPLFLHKVTGWPRVGLLDACLPESRYVHVVRDGRNVAASWLRMPWWRGHLGPERWHAGPLTAEQRAAWDASGRSFTVLAGLAWCQFLDAHDAAEQALADDDRWLTVRYEDVVADPLPSMQRIAKHFGLAPNAAFDAAVAAWPVCAERPTAWLPVLGEVETAKLEAAIAPHLAHWGYEPGSRPQAVAT